MRVHVRRQGDSDREAPPRAQARTPEPALPVEAVLDAAGRAQDPGRGAGPAVSRAIDDLQASAGNDAVARLFEGGPTATRHRDLPARVAAGHAVTSDAPVVQTSPEDEAAAMEAGAEPAAGGDSEAMELGAGAPTPGPSWTKVGPPSPTTYNVTGSLRDAATAISARKEAGSVTASPTADTETWAPEGGTDKVTAARVTVDQVLEMPVWTDKASATKNQQAEWDRFYAALTTHEAGHVSQDKTSFAGAHGKMVGKSPTDADAALDAVDKQAETDNDTYDAGNSHGLTQGTGINPNIDEVTKVP